MGALTIKGGPTSMRPPGPCLHRRQRNSTHVGQGGPDQHGAIRHFARETQHRWAEHCEDNGNLWRRGPGRELRVDTIIRAVARHPPLPEQTAQDGDILPDTGQRVRKV
jgi:hypothetical protein